MEVSSLLSRFEPGRSVSADLQELVQPNAKPKAEMHGMRVLFCQKTLGEQSVCSVSEKASCLQSSC
jgi:hypothetical protein